MSAEAIERLPIVIDPEPSSSNCSYHSALAEQPTCASRCWSRLKRIFGYLSGTYISSLICSPFDKIEVTTLGLIHLLCTLAIGISLSISVEIDEAKNVTYTKLYYFLIVYMWISIVWLFGALCCGKPTGCCLSRIQNDAHIPGYLIIGVTFLCIGSAFISAVEVLPFVVYKQSCTGNSTHNLESLEKRLSAEAFYKSTEFVFLILQLYFFCRFSSKTFVESTSMRIFLLHIIAVNLCSWFYTIVDESVLHDHDQDPKPNCPAYNTIEHFKRHSDKFLYPFSIEYSVMSSVLLFLLWYGLTPPEDEPPLNHDQAPTEHETSYEKIKNFFFNRCCREGKPDGEKKSVSFWKAAKCGYVFGVVMLIFILIIVVVVAVEYKDDQTFSLSFFYASRMSVQFIMTIVCLFGLKYLKKHSPLDTSIHTNVDTALIMIGVSGCYLLTAFQVTAAASDYPNNCTMNNTGIPKNLDCNFLKLNIADSLSSLVQFTLQAYFIVRALKRRAGKLVPYSKQTVSSALVVRRCSAFLSIGSIGMWAMDTFVLNDDYIEKVESHAYSKKTWLILSHVAFPLCIFFRLHSVFCCFEIVINRFAVDGLDEHVSRDLEDLDVEDSDR